MECLTRGHIRHFSSAENKKNHQYRIRCRNQRRGRRGHAPFHVAAIAPVMCNFRGTMTDTSYYPRTRGNLTWASLVHSLMMHRHNAYFLSARIRSLLLDISNHLLEESHNT